VVRQADVDDQPDDGGTSRLMAVMASKTSKASVTCFQ
jgi:hypothetical protein